MGLVCDMSIVTVFPSTYDILTWSAGHHNQTADPTLLMDFGTLVSKVSLSKTSIINPPYESSKKAFAVSPSLLFMAC